MPSGEKTDSPSKIIHLQGLLVKHFYFPSVLFPAIMTSWVLKEDLCNGEYCRKNCYAFFFFISLSDLPCTPIKEFTGVSQCSTTLMNT